MTNFGSVQPGTLEPGLHIVIPIVQRVAIIDTRVQPHQFQEIDAASAEYQTRQADRGHELPRRRPVRLTTCTSGSAPTSRPRSSTRPSTTSSRRSCRRYKVDADPRRPRRDPVTGQGRPGREPRPSTTSSSTTSTSRTSAFSDEFQAAIEAKQVAQQQVQTEQQILAQKRIQAEQAVAQAQGQADSNVKLAEGQAAATIALANGQATANEALAASLSDQILQYQYIQKLTDKITVMLVPSGNASIFDLKGLLDQATPTPTPDALTHPGGTSRYPPARERWPSG